MKRTHFLYAAFVVVLVALAWLVFGPSMNPSHSFTRETGKAKPKIEVVLGLATCQVCGYDAVEQEGAACLNCGQAINEAEMADEMLADMRSLIIQRQLEYFLPDTLGSPIHFMKPKVSDKGYPKSTNWKPLVYESEVFEYHKVIMALKQAQNLPMP